MNDRLKQLMDFHRQDPADAFCTYGIALEHAKAGRVDEALKWLEKTTVIDANHAYAWYQRARLLSESGRADEARNAIDEGLAAAQRSGDAHAAEELRQLGITIG